MSSGSDAANHTNGDGSGSVRSQQHARNKPSSGNIAKRACDQCKFRKIKCSLSQPCKACVSMSFECTFYQPQKKRGPAGHRVSQIRQQQNQGQKKSPQTSPTPLTTDSSSSFPFSGSRPQDVPPVDAITMPDADWAAHANVAMPLNGNALGGASAASAVAPGGWSTDAASLTSQGSSGMSGWNSDRPDAEYWAPDSLNAQIPIFDFPGSNIYLKPSLPSIVRPEAEVSRMDAMDAHAIERPSVSMTSVHSLPPEMDDVGLLWPPSIQETNMIPWIDVYFDRLHPTLPVINRSSLFIRMLNQEHRRNPQFGSMLLSLCAFSLTQPIEIDERATTSSRATQARIMMHEAIKMRSCSDFGEQPTIEAILTSFFLFGCLFGSYQHNAAWLRLREALDLAATLGLNDPDTYHNLSSEEKGQRLRTYLVLSITERAYALQRRHPITFWGKPGFSMRPIHDFIHSATHSVVSGIIVHNEKDAEGMMGLARLMELFDAIDEGVVDCWNRQCSAQTNYCQKLTEAKAITIHDNLNCVHESERFQGYDWFERNRAAPGNEQPRAPRMFLLESQCADLFVTKKWLQNRVWVLCSTHGLLRAQAERPELTFDYAITVAESALKICQSLRLSSMETHGIGIVEKLYDIIVSAVNVLYNMHAPLNTSYGLGSSTDSISGTAGMSHPASSLSDVPGATGPPRFALSDDYLLLMSSFRGGNHPYLEKFKAFLNSLSGRLDRDSSGWRTGQP